MDDNLYPYHVVLTIRAKERRLRRKVKEKLSYTVRKHVLTSGLPRNPKHSLFSPTVTISCVSEKKTVYLLHNVLLAVQSEQVWWNSAPLSIRYFMCLHWVLDILHLERYAYLTFHNSCDVFSHGEPEDYIFCSSYTRLWFLGNWNEL